jgi:hypothetical protein
MRILVAILALTFLTSRPGIAAEPELVLRPVGLTLRHLPPVFSEELVARHLDTGLTTSFVFGVDAGRGSPKGAAEVRIRYDLWDERYVLERRDLRRDSVAAAALAKPRLGEWWRSLELVVASGLPSLPPARAKVTLHVLPFSQAEQRDAQDWLLRSFQAPGENREPGGADTRPSAAAAAPLRNLYGSMLAASIGQRSLITYSWTVAVTTESR